MTAKMQIHDRKMKVISMFGYTTSKHVHSAQYMDFVREQRGLSVKKIDGEKIISARNVEPTIVGHEKQ